MGKNWAISYFKSGHLGVYSNRLIRGDTAWGQVKPPNFVGHGVEGLFVSLFTSTFD